MTREMWSELNVPDLSGTTALVTGASSGIGLETARILAEHGARVLLGCRDPAKATAALDTIRAAAPHAEVSVVPLDLADLHSVRLAAEIVNDTETQLNLLINNAGVMAVPLQQTADGFEMQFGTNHLGHFALTGLVLDRLLDTPGSRVVNVSSNGHRMGRINFDDLDGARGYAANFAFTASTIRL